MPKSVIDKRARLTQAAAKLAYKRGFGNANLARIAQEARVPLGNVYYYFKTKEQIGEAIVAQRTEEFQLLRTVWEQANSPKDRLFAYIDMTVSNREAVARAGCPIGSFVSELSKNGGKLKKRANSLFSNLLDWLVCQFRELGRQERAESLALHLLSSLQGASLLTHSFGDEQLLQIEAENLRQWIREL